MAEQDAEHQDSGVDPKDFTTHGESVRLIELQLHEDSSNEAVPSNAAVDNDSTMRVIVNDHDNLNGNVDDDDNDDDDDEDGVVNHHATTAPPNSKKPSDVSDTLSPSFENNPPIRPDLLTFNNGTTDRRHNNLQAIDGNDSTKRSSMNYDHWMPLSPSSDESRRRSSTEKQLLIQSIDTKEAFDNLMKKKDILIVVKYWGDWCKPCKRIAPHFELLADKYPTIEFYKVNVEHNEEVALANNVTILPTFIFYKDGENINEIQGAYAERLEKTLTKQALKMQENYSMDEAHSRRHTTFGNEVEVFEEVTEVMNRGTLLSSPGSSGTCIDGREDIVIFDGEHPRATYAPGPSSPSSPVHDMASPPSPASRTQTRKFSVGLSEASDSLTDFELRRVDTPRFLNESQVEFQTKKTSVSLEGSDDTHTEFSLKRSDTPRYVNLTNQHHHRTEQVLNRVSFLVTSSLNSAVSAHKTHELSEAEDKLSAGGNAKERTFVAVKPDGVQRGMVGDVIQRFEQRGFTMVAGELRMASVDLLKNHYGQMVGKPFFKRLVRYMTSGPVFAMVWEGKHVVKVARSMLTPPNPLDEATPGTIRGDYCIDARRNICHCSTTVGAAKKEIDLWFYEADVHDYRLSIQQWV